MRSRFEEVGHSFGVELHQLVAGLNLKTFVLSGTDSD